MHCLYEVNKEKVIHLSIHMVHPQIYRNMSIYLGIAIYYTSRIMNLIVFCIGPISHLCHMKIKSSTLLLLKY